VTDDRGFCHFGTDIDGADIDAGTIVLAKMAANSVDSDQYVDGSIDLAHMSANSIDSDQYVDASIDLAHLSADSVDDTKAGNRVPALTRRQGGSATEWTTTGTTTYTPTMVRMQCGVATSGASGLVTITFPVAFSYRPLFFVTSIEAANMPVAFIDVVPTTTQVTVIVKEASTGNGISGTFFHWLAVGPE